MVDKLTADATRLVAGEVSKAISSQSQLSMTCLCPFPLSVPPSFRDQIAVERSPLTFAFTTRASR